MTKVKLSSVVEAKEYLETYGGRIIFQGSPPNMGIYWYDEPGEEKGKAINETEDERCKE